MVRGERLRRRAEGIVTPSAATRPWRWPTYSRLLLENPTPVVELADRELMARWREALAGDAE